MRAGRTVIRTIRRRIIGQYEKGARIAPDAPLGEPYAAGTYQL
jgi:hypothetical protein